jgi:hypothetical protein
MQRLMRPSVKHAGVVVMIKEMAQDFNKSALNEIANSAELRANLLVKHIPKPWERSTEEADAIDTFKQLAAYCRRVINMMGE